MSVRQQLKRKSTTGLVSKLPPWDSSTGETPEDEDILNCNYYGAERMTNRAGWIRDIVTTAEGARLPKQSLCVPENYWVPLAMLNWAITVQQHNVRLIGTLKTKYEKEACEAMESHCYQRLWWYLRCRDRVRQEAATSPDILGTLNEFVWREAEGVEEEMTKAAATRGNHSQQLTIEVVCEPKKGWPVGEWNLLIIYGLLLHAPAEAGWSKNKELVAQVWPEARWPPPRTPFLQAVSSPWWKGNIDSKALTQAGAPAVRQLKKLSKEAKETREASVAKTQSDKAKGAVKAKSKAPPTKLEKGKGPAKAKVKREPARQAGTSLKKGKTSTLQEGSEDDEEWPGIRLLESEDEETLPNQKAKIQEGRDGSNVDSEGEIPSHPGSSSPDEEGEDGNATEDSEAEENNLGKGQNENEAAEVKEHGKLEEKELGKEQKDNEAVEVKAQGNVDEVHASPTHTKGGESTDLSDAMVGAVVALLDEKLDSTMATLDGYRDTLRGITEKLGAIPVPSRQEIAMLQELEKDVSSAQASEKAALGAHRLQRKHIAEHLQAIRDGDISEAKVALLHVVAQLGQTALSSPQAVENASAALASLRAEMPERTQLPSSTAESHRNLATSIAGGAAPFSSPKRSANDLSDDNCSAGDSKRRVSHTCSA